MVILTVVVHHRVKMLKRFLTVELDPVHLKPYISGLGLNRSYLVCRFGACHRLAPVVGYRASLLRDNAVSAVSSQMPSAICKQSATSPAQVRVISVTLRLVR